MNAWSDTSTQSIIKGFKECWALKDIKWKDYILWREDHEDNYSSSDETDGSDYIVLWCVCTFLLE
jgi:hypothetical protein